MSRTSRLVAFALCFAAAGPGVQAQQPAQETPEELIARIDSLLPLYQGARADADEANRRLQEARQAADPITLDTVHVGPLRIVALPEQSSEAEEMYGRIWEEYAPFVDHSASLDKAHFTFQWTAKTVAIPMTGLHFRSEQRAWRSAANMEDLIRASIGKALMRDAHDTGLDDISGETLRSPENFGWVYRRLATTPSKVARGCLEGAPGACWSALGLDAGPEAYLDWYLPEEFPALVEQLGFRSWRREDRETWEACVEQASVSACEAWLALAVKNAVLREWMIPLRQGDRITMVWVALQMGGEGAWGRLLGDPALPAGDALRYASGATTEQLETEWRRQVLAHRPDTQAGLLTTKWTALFWMLVFGVLAMRSTRWRLA